MSPDPLELLRARAHRTSVRLVWVAGITTGLLAGIGVLLLDVSPRGAAAVWALTLAVSGTIVMVSVHLARQAGDIEAVGAQLRGQVADGHARHVETANALGELRNRVAAAEREVAVLRGQLAAAAAVDPVIPGVASATRAEEAETLLLRRPDGEAIA